jgi:hypothetical protein
VTQGRGRSGATFGNVLLALAALVLFAALMVPQWRATAAEERIEAVVSGIESVRAGAEATRDQTGVWPPSSPATALAPGLSLPDSTTTMEWRRLESVVVPPPPADTVLPGADEPGLEPPMPTPEYFQRGAISLHTADDALLAVLLERYPASFVHDTVWTLLLPRVQVPPQ